jgi:hypothetical protein
MRLCMSCWQQLQMSQQLCRSQLVLFVPGGVAYESSPVLVWREELYHIFCLA